MCVCIQVSELCGGDEKPTWGSSFNYTLGVQNLTLQDTPLCPLSIKPCGCPEGRMSLIPIHVVNDRDIPAFRDATHQMETVAAHHWNRQGDALKSHLNDQGITPDSYMDTDGVHIDQQDSNEYQFADRPPIAIPQSDLRLQDHKPGPPALPDWATEPFVPLTLP